MTYHPPFLDRNLVVEPVDESMRRKVVTQQVVYSHGLDDVFPQQVIIPAGFRTDGYSLPPRGATIIILLIIGAAVTFSLGRALGFTITEAYIACLIGGLSSALFAAYILGDPWGAGYEAAVVHDRLTSCNYQWRHADQTSYGKRNNALHDKLFRRAMRQCGVGFLRTLFYFWCTRLFSGLVTWLIERNWIKW